MCCCIACGDPTLETPDAGTTDAAEQPVPTPAPDPLPARAPYTLTTIRGHASGAKRVIIRGGANPLATTVVPQDSSFCLDVPTLVPGPYAFELVSQAADGRLSEPASVSTTFDPAAPAIVGAQTCAGADPAGCSGRAEICDGQRDDDCDTLSDARDPDCATCEDDPLEPNDDARAPRIEPGRYDGLTSCPSNPDWYGLFVRAGERLDARVFFLHANGNLDLELQSENGEALARSVSLDDDESVTFTATTTAQLELLVFGTLTAPNEYVLDVSLTGR